MWNAASDEVRELMSPGNKVRLRYEQPDNPNNKLMWVLAIVDHDHVVYRMWLKHKQRWHYAVEYVYMFELVKEHLTLVETFDLEEHDDGPLETQLEDDGPLAL